MDYYQPKLLHASMTTLLAVALLALSDIASGKALTALVVGASVFLAMTGVIVWMIWYAHPYNVFVYYAETFIKLNPEQRSALAYKLPHFNLRASRGRVAVLFEGTEATTEHIRIFLTESDSRHTSPKNGWNSKEKPLWAWEEIYDWLVRNGKVVEDSAAGNHSYMWIGSAYQSMSFYYLDRAIRDLNADDDDFAQMVYASENHLPTLAPPPSAPFQGQRIARGVENSPNRGSGG